MTDRAAPPTARGKMCPSWHRYDHGPRNINVGCELADGHEGPHAAWTWENPPFPRIEWTDPVASPHTATAPTRDEEGAVFGNFALIQTIGGDWKLVDASDDDAPIADFVNEEEARRFMRFLLNIAERCTITETIEPSAGYVPSVSRERFNEIAGRWIPDEMADAIEAELFGASTTPGWHRTYECPTDLTRWTVTGGENPGCPECHQKGRWVDEAAEALAKETGGKTVVVVCAPRSPETPQETT